MQRLIYCSYPMTPPRMVILDIVRASERRNVALGLSGVLHYDNQAYAQLIEGERPALDALWKDLRADPRHEIAWHRFEPVEARALSTKLPMGFSNGRALRELVPPDPPGLIWAEGQAGALADGLIELGRRLYPAAAAG